MRREYSLNEKYLYIPVQPGHEQELIEFYTVSKEDGKEVKELEYLIPVNMELSGSYSAEFFAKIPTSFFKGDTLIVEGNAPESFFDAIEIAEERKISDCRKPVIHMAPDTGWCNDPNGLVYKNGVYHFYYQYNPVDTVWNNMTWGHATSTDLLHWTQHDIVMIPEENGVMYSGSGIVNEKGLLGLSEDALLFFYTMAGGINAWSKGKEFTQNIAYSLDGGKSLHKIENPCLDTVSFENRDPKVFWHEPSKAYVMPLWIKGCEYGIFRSTDLVNWERSQTLFFEDTWECPDLFELSDENGEKCWFFWTADGFYFPGDFDGYEFKANGERHKAYLTPIPYAAQTYSNTGDRTISIPWYRVKNDGRPFTGTYGIPVELTYEKNENGCFLVQKPVRELFEQAKKVEYQSENGKYNVEITRDKALIVKMRLKDGLPIHSWKVEGSKIEYKILSGVFIKDGQHMMAGEGHHNFLMVIDDMVLEIFFENGKKFASYQLNCQENYLEIPENMIEYCEFFEVK